MAVALLLLNEDVELLQLQLHVLDSVTDEFAYSDNIMRAGSHGILLTCDYRLKLKIVI